MKRLIQFVRLALMGLPMRGDMKCIFVMPTKDTRLVCGEPTCPNSDFCQKHIESQQNACQHARVRAVQVWDKDATPPRWKTGKQHIQCGKMRAMGSVLCPHHKLLDEFKPEKKTTEERLGGYAK